MSTSCTGIPSQALRGAIQTEADRVWQASAFLFMILIEQKIANFRSLPTIRESLTGERVPEIHGRDGDTIDAQLEYLATQLEDDQ